MFPTRKQTEQVSGCPTRGTYSLPSPTLLRNNGVSWLRFLSGGRASFFDFMFRFCKTLSSECLKTKAQFVESQRHHVVTVKAFRLEGLLDGDGDDDK